MTTTTKPVTSPPAGTVPPALARELATYRRELPKLLEEGLVGRYVLIKEDQVLSTWDTQGDAIQAGRERFGLEPIFVKCIDPRDVERFQILDARKDSA